MQHQVITAAPDALDSGALDAMFRLRHEVFHDRLGWAVQSAPGGREIDEYDALPSVRYILATAPGQRVDACWRLLPTVGPNMLRDRFPELLHGAAAPAAGDVWELSRFAIATHRVGAGEAVSGHQLGFGELSVALMAEAARFACAHGIARYVTVTTAAIERLLVRQGLHVHRLGAPLRIGAVLTVACFIEVDDITLRAVGFHAQ